MVGRLLRDVEPELMDGLIQATKDGDQSKFQELCGSETLETNEEDEQQEEKIESENDEEVFLFVNIFTTLLLPF